jgi:hypothetical protein
VNEPKPVHWLLFYRDGDSGTFHNRQTHMECITFNDHGIISPVTRSTKANPSYQACATK